MEEETDDEVSVHHVAKRYRHNKNTVIAFDNEDRMEYLSGFRKRKNKRRQAAEQHKVYKERQKRLQDRRERRAALKEAKGDAVDEEGDQTMDGPEDGEDEIANASAKDISGTATYEGTQTTTIVRVTVIGGEEEDFEKPVRKTGSHASNLQKLKPVKVKFKKKKVQSEKRMRKLTRREKSVPKNLRSRRDKKRKK